MHLSVRPGTASHRNLTELLVAENETAEDFITPYKGSKMLESALGVKVRPQMLYNYVKAGRIPAKDGKIKVTDFVRWGVAYANKKAGPDDPDS